MAELSVRDKDGRPRGKRILLSTGSSDSHTWNLVFLQLLLEEGGHEVINLGACVPDKLFMDSVRRHRPDAIVFSSVNGHGFLDGERLVRLLRQDPVGEHIPAMIGGKLGILGDGNEQYSKALLDAGFDAVFTDSTSPEGLTTYLRKLPEQKTTQEQKTVQEQQTVQGQQTVSS